MLIIFLLFNLSKLAGLSNQLEKDKTKYIIHRQSVEGVDNVIHC